MRCVGRGRSGGRWRRRNRRFQSPGGYWQLAGSRGEGATGAERSELVGIGLCVAAGVVGEGGEESSDAVLRGAVVSFYTIPLIFDSVTGRATTVSVNVLVKVTLTDRKTKKVLYQNQNFLYSERYEISRDAAGYFDESAASIDRLSRTLAGSLVSAILEGF